MAEFSREKMLILFGHVQRRDKDEAPRNIIIDDSRWKAKSRQTKTETAIPGERVYCQKPDKD